MRSLARLIFLLLLTFPLWGSHYSSNRSDSACPTIGLAQPADYCLDEGSEVRIDILLAPGSEPGVFSIDGPSQLTIKNGQGNERYLVIPDILLMGNYTLTYTLLETPTDPSCQRQVSISFIIAPKPNPTFKTPDTACNAADIGESTIVDITQYLDYNGTGSWTLNNQAIQDPTSFDFLGYPSGSVYFGFMTNDAVYPCVNQQITLRIDVKNCYCPLQSFDLPMATCNIVGQINLDSYLNSGTAPGVWSVVSADPHYALPETNIFHPFGLFPGSYIFTYTLTNTFENCPIEVSDTIMVIPDYTLEDTLSINACNLDENVQAKTIIDFDQFVDAELFLGYWTAPEKYNLVGELDYRNVDFYGKEPGLYPFKFQTYPEYSPCGIDELILMVEVLDCSCPNIVVDNNQSICNELGNINLDDYINTEFDFNLKFKNGPIPASDLDNVDFFGWNIQSLPPGEYNFEIKLDTLIPGCLTREPFSIIIEEQVELNLPDNIDLCNNTASGIYDVSVDLIALQNGIDGAWIIPNGLTLQNGIINTSNLLANQQFEVYFEPVVPQSCEEFSSKIKINIIDCDCPIIDISAIDPICENSENSMLDLNQYIDESTESSVKIIAQNGNLNISNGICNTADLTPGIYPIEFVLDTVFNNCNLSQTIDLIITESPEFNLILDTILCSEPSVLGPTLLDLTTLVNIEGEWTFPDNWPTVEASSINTDYLNPESSYELTFTSKANFPCEDISKTLTIFIQDCSCPVVDLVSNPVLCNENQELFDLNSISSDQMVEGFFVLKDIANQEVIIEYGMVDPSLLESGNYTIYFYPNEKPQTDCPQYGEAFLTIQEPAYPGEVNAPIDLCLDSPGELLTLNDYITNEDGGGQWVFHNIPSNFQGFDEVGILNTNGLKEGEYTLEYTLESEQPCSNKSVLIDLKIHNIAELSLGNIDIITCENDQVELQAIIEDDSSNFDGFWLNEIGDTISNQSSIMVNEGGEYEYHIVDNLTQCSRSISAIVETDLSFPILDISYINTCENTQDGKIQIDYIEGDHFPFTINISGPQLIEERIDSPEEFPREYFDLPAGEYEVEVTNSQFCREYQTKEIEKIKDVNAWITSTSDNIVGIGDSIPITLDIEDMSNVSEISWHGGDPTQHGYFEKCNDLSCLDVVVQPRFANNMFCAKIINSAGCETIKCIEIRAEERRKFYMANVFSYSGEDANRCIYPQAEQGVIKEIKSFQIYGRSGDRVFSNFNFSPNEELEGWNGLISNKHVEIGVYVWHMEVEWEENVGQTETNFTGSVTIVN